MLRGIVRAMASIALVLLASMGCGDDEQRVRGVDPATDASSKNVLATVDGKPISADSVDLPLRLELHDLDYARYERRLARLRRLIAERVGSRIEPGSGEYESRVSIHLVPPSPPRLDIPDGDAQSRGANGAAATIVAFVDFESAHSRRLQPELMRLLDRYPDRLRLLVRDLPLPYHRFAWDAAVASRCAADQEAYWAYHDLLLAEQPNLAPTDLSRYATALGLDRAVFEACVDSSDHAARVTADLALAERLGVRRAATVFVNGLYLTGQATFERMDPVIRAELERLGIDSTPARLTAASKTLDANDESSSSTGAGNSRSDLPEIPPELLSEPELVLTLSRAEVDRALADRSSLDQKLEASKGEFSGQRLLSIRSVDEGDFFTRLGLEEGDVLLVVNGEFSTVDHPALWTAFESGDKVVVLVMRRGLPHTYEYRIRSRGDDVGGGT